MTNAAPVPEATQVTEDQSDKEFRRLSALVVDDSAAQRKLLKMMLRKWNFDVYEAEDGYAALGICQSVELDFIISDWMMPEMDGPDFCREVRKMRRQNYIYFILLTSKSEKNDVAAGLDAGADDFLVKPTDLGELHARLRAGQRLIQMQDALVDKNRRITEAFDRLNALYDSIDRDLKSAAKLQRALIPERQNKCGPVDIGLLYRSAGHVGGDLLGFYKVSDHRIAAYSIDVSGHGVSSALMTARLSNLFTSQHLDENIGLSRQEDGSYLPRDPAAIATDLNDRLQDEADNDQYFTMLFADINVATGHVRFCQAGHPNPALMRTDGTVSFVGDGGAPIGLIPDMTYETYVVHLSPGDRMLMFSDGITEAENSQGEMYEEEGLSRALTLSRGLAERMTLEAVRDDLTMFCGNDSFEDDVSALLLTMPEPD